MKARSHIIWLAVLWCTGTANTTSTAIAEQSLHVRIDAIVEAANPNTQPTPVADDYEFVRRVYLDLAGRIPAFAETQNFVADKDGQKRRKLIDSLLNNESYAAWMKTQFNSVLMERRGEDPAWENYLTDAFAANRPWDEMVQEMLRPDWSENAVPGASFFVTKRLEKYGSQPTDYPGLTRDVGRLFLGVDLKCAQCHDHLTIDDYKQRDFQGMFIVFNNTYLQQGKLAEKLLSEPIEYSSVFIGQPEKTVPRVPMFKDIPLPEFAEGEEYSQPPDRKKRTPGIPKFSPLTTLATEMTSGQNDAFAENLVNRIWFLLLGRGIVEPLDQHHADNPPSHPELLDLLAKEFAVHDMDIKWLLREITLTKAYQRSSKWIEDRDGGGEPPQPRSFLIGNERRILPEQVQESLLVATGPFKSEETVAKQAELKPAFLKAFAGPPMEPELEFAPTLQSALFMMNDPLVEKLLEPTSDNLVERAVNVKGDAVATKEIYLSVLSRLPSEAEQTTAVAYLSQHPDRRGKAIGNLVWSLLASTEFCTNH